jgi:hypothetical protein
VFGSPLIIGVMMALVAGVSLVDVVRERASVFDARVTGRDRHLLFRLAAFVLLPLSVLAHEGGHALAVKLFGGEVVGFGFYLYYGYVEHIGTYTPIERALISVAGPGVNVVLGLAAVAFAWFRPTRKSINYLLFVFSAFELGNALIFYPVFDALGGIAGDWETIYSRRTPAFSIAVGVIHLAILGAAVIFWRNTRIQAGYEARTGFPLRSKPVQPLTDDQRRELAGILQDAAAAAGADWPHRMSIGADAQQGGTQVVMRWESRGFRRALLVHAGMQKQDTSPRIELHAAVQARDDGAPQLRRPVGRFTGQPTSAELTPYLRRILEFVDGWDGSTPIAPN